MQTGMIPTRRYRKGILIGGNIIKRLLLLTRWGRERAKRIQVERIARMIERMKRKEPEQCAMITQCKPDKKDRDEAAKIWGSMGL